MKGGDVEDEESKNELLRLRQKGVLPELEIAGQVYEVDWCNRLLRALDNPEVEPISFSEQGGNFYGDYYYLPYDFKEKKIVGLGFDATTLPENVVIVKFPGGLKLDPFAVARENGLNQRKFVENNPISKRIIAEVIPLNQTALVRFVELNKQKQIPQIAKKSSASIKNRKGNGLSK